MERLKAALDKAREARAAAPAAAAGARRTPPNGRPNADVSALWEALAPLETEPKAISRKRLVTLTGGADATPFDVLRTRVLQLMGANDWRRVALTSPLPASGKTTTAFNLAVALARHGDLRVILFDFDMRRPGLARLLDVPEVTDIARLLAGEVDFAEQARRIGTNLALSMNRKPMRESADVLLRRTTRETLDDIERRYRPDLMIFDLPPMLVGDETQAFVTCVDCAILVAEGNVSTIPQVDICEKDLAEQTNVLGVVLNKCRFPSDGLGYYYEYG